MNSISEILHPAVREGLRYLEFDQTLGLEILHQGDLPARTGMGSSSSFAVGLINALLTLQGTRSTAEELAAHAIELEQARLKDNVGSQDQVAAAHGGLNLIRFGTDGVIRVEPVLLPAGTTEALESHLMLFYTGTSRLASEVARGVIENLQAKHAMVSRMRDMVDVAHRTLVAGDLTAFGEMLHETWMLKRSLSDKVTTPHIDEMYELARHAGALGGKLLGAGSSGFMLFFVPPERQLAVIKSLRHCLHVPFRLEPGGSTIIYSSPDQDEVPARHPVQAQYA